jgi:isoquinoline 1-oxidoreductase beta subunit
MKDMIEIPEIEVHIAQNHLKGGGIGEPVFPSVAPAVANAVFSATGVRLRELPFQTGLLAEGCGSTSTTNGQTDTSLSF